MKKLVLGGLSAVAMAFSMNAMAANFVAGKDYTVVANPVKTAAPAGKLEVREFFWYGCPHCFKLEPHMQTWLKKIPSDVYFLRTPAAMNKVWEQGARGYYVSEALGVKPEAEQQHRQGSRQRELGRRHALQDSVLLLARHAGTP